MTRPIVLHVAEAFEGGVFESVAGICHSLADEFEFHVLHGKRATTPEDVPSSFPPGTRFTRWSAGQTISPYSNAKGILEVRRAADGAIRVHAHSSTAGALCRLAFPLRAGFVLYSPRCYGFLNRDFSAPVRASYDAVERLLGMLPHPVVACGTDEFRRVRKRARYAYCVANAVDLLAIDAAISGVTRAPKRTVVAAGRISPQKDFGRFAEVAAALAGDGVDFLWVGDGDPPSGGLPANLRITGWLSHTDVLRRMASGHVFVHTARWEGLSRTCLEAAAIGLPMLLSPTDGAFELTRAGAGSILCASAGEFVTALRSLLSNEPERLEMGARSRVAVESRHDERNARKEWKALYDHGVPGSSSMLSRKSAIL